MFDRFTDRARKAMGAARRSAELLKYDCITPEHILLGLMENTDGVAGGVLQALQKDTLKIKSRIQAATPAGTISQIPAQLPFTATGKRVLENAIFESRSLDHNYVGSEHLLLGLLRTQDTTAARVLTEFGITLAETRSATVEFLGREAGPPQQYTAADGANWYLELMARAMEDARGRKEEFSSEHLLLALSNCKSGLAAKILAAHGLEPESLRAEIDKMRREGS